MTRIATVSATNLKVPLFRYDLGPVSVIVGSNFVGKSAVLQAVQLGLLGWIPGLAKTNDGIFSLSCGQSISVQLRLSDGKKIEREFVSKGGSVNRTETVPPGFVVPDVLMDAGEYLRLSGRSQVQYVSKLVTVSDKWSGESVLKQIAETPIACDTNSIENVTQIKGAIVHRLSESDHQRHADDEPIQAWLEVVLNDLRDQIKSTAAALSKLQKYQETEIDLRWAGHTKASEVEPPNVEKQITDKSAELQKLREQIAVAESKRQQAQQVERMRTELKRSLSEPDPSPALEAIKKQLLEVKPVTAVVGLRELASGLSDAKGQASVAQSILKRIESQVQELRRQREIDMKSSKCPRCHRGGKGFHEAIEATFMEAIGKLNEENQKATAELGRALKEATGLQINYNKALVAEHAAQNNALLLEKLKAELARLETMVKTRADWQRQVDGLNAIEAPEPAAVEDMSRKGAVLVGELSALEAKQKGWVTSRHEQKRHAEARAQADQTAAELLVLKALAKSVESIQSAMVADAFGSILSDVNRFCDGILLTALDYHDGEIGRWSDKNWVPHRSFSGTEALIAGAGISIALARQSPIRIVLLDEIGRLQIQNKNKLVDRLLALTKEGFIDQAILVDVTPEPYLTIEGINVITV